MHQFGASLGQIILLCLSLALFVVFLNPNPSFGAASAVVPSTDYSFREQWQGGVVTHEFTVKNTGDKELRLQGQKITGPHTSARFKNSVPPGKETEVVMSVDTSEATGDVDAGLILITNDPARPRIEFHVRGHVRPIVTFQPFGALFFSAYKGQSPEKSIEIVNHYTEPLTITKVQSDSDRFSYRLETIKKGSEYRFFAKVNPKAAPGRTMERVVFLTNNEHLPRFSVGVNIFVKNEVYTFPDDIDFGTVDLDQIRKEPQLLNLLIQSILVKQRPGTGKDFQITLHYTLPFIAVKKDPASGSETYRLDVSLIPKKMTRGKFDSFITVRTNDKKVPELKIPVRAVVR